MQAAAFADAVHTLTYFQYHWLKLQAKYDDKHGPKHIPDETVLCMEECETLVIHVLVLGSETTTRTEKTSEGVSKTTTSIQNGDKWL